MDEPQILCVPIVAIDTSAEFPCQFCGTSISREFTLTSKPPRIEATLICHVCGQAHTLRARLLSTDMYLTLERSQSV
jgi:transcription elongation factor Elf1